jgi:hypothetical protein
LPKFDDCYSFHSYSKKSIQMKKSSAQTILISMVLAALIIPANAWSQRKSKTGTATDKIKLEYHLPEGKPLGYSNVTNMVQTMDFNGQTMQANVNATLICTVTGRGKDNDLQIAEIKIDTLSQNVITPQGSDGGMVTEVMGRSFKMTLSPSGKEADLSEAEKLIINTGSVQTNVAQSFVGFFPNLPGNEIKPGDTWTSDDSVNTRSGTYGLRMVIHSENKFEGIEKTDGIDCARITSVISGTRDQNAQTMGMNVSTGGTFTGTAVLLFAVREGYFISSSSVSKMTGTIDIAGEQNISMPVVADISTVNKLKK